MPTLWGYTEQARRVKKTVTVQKSGARRVWNADTFREDVLRRLDAIAGRRKSSDSTNSVAELPNAELKWGSGKDRGSFSVVNRSVSQKSLITVNLSDGELWLNFNWLNQSDNERSARDSLLRCLSKISSLGIDDTQPEKGRIVAVKRWGPVRNELEKCLEQSFAESYPK